MIYEYALEPELVVTWGDRERCGYFIDKFGFDRQGEATGRVISQYPEDWQERVKETLKETPLTVIEKKRIEELLKHITKKQPKVTRFYTSISWDSEKSWLENAEAEQENTSRPFHAILACENPRGIQNVILGDSIYPIEPGDRPSPLWHESRSRIICRSADAMATCLEPMLRCATLILFIDPHFRANDKKWTDPLKQFLDIIWNGRHYVKIEYHTSIDRSASPTWEHFRRECEKYLPRLVPPSCTLTVRCWKKHGDSEKLHNRYILTDIGGVLLGTGFDEDDQDEDDQKATDDLLLLGRESYRHRLRQYHTKPVFELEGDPITITTKDNA